ncbi:MAG TPA: adenylate/guanylate cyclase domain-containing protein [Candidatus Dormibacteraeota bacterium]
MSSCANCGRENPADAGFCNGCGKSLVAMPAPREQRKTVTVLFCDVTGSTAMGELLDPESLRQVMRRYFDAARLVIEQHGGTVEKFIGDAVMAVFGVPVLHEDDALRAVRAAWGLRDALNVLNVTLERDYATTVTIRTGVNTGQVVTGTEERLATGDAVNVAARLEQAAAPGDIVIGPETWRLVRDAVTVEPLAPLELKGKSLPLAAYRVLGIDTDAHAISRRAETGLVGRATPLRMLRDAFTNVIDGQSCSLFTILGAAGVGKSRLTAEFLSSVDATILRGRCLSYGEGITYWPVITIVKQLLDAPDGSAAAELMARDANVAAAIRTLLGEQVAATSSTEIAWAVRKVIECAAESHPLVVVFDDVHWGEPTLFDLIEHISDLSRGAPILMLCLGRPELLDRRPGWGGGKLNATTVLLEPLNATETEALIDVLLPTDDGVDAELRERIRTTAAGNPLFLEEIVAMVRESSSHDVIVPPTIKALLAARFDQLRPEERSVLERGSVEGQSFHRGAVEVMAPDERDVAGRLLTLVRKDLLRPDRAVFAGEDAFAFRHLLIRDAAYDSLPKAARAELHASFAGWLEQRGRDLEELDEIAGYHLEQAFRYRTELGPADEHARAVAMAAATHLEAAGRRALDRGDASAAVNLLERSEALRPEHAIDVAVEQSLIQGIAMAGRLTEAVARSEMSAAALAERGDRLGQLQVQLIGAMWRTNLDPTVHEGDLAELVSEARPAIEHGGDDGAVAMLELAAGYVDHYRCHFESALVSLTRSVAYATKAGKLWLAHNAIGVASAAIANGPTPATEGLLWLKTTADASPIYQPLLEIWRADLLASIGQYEEARSLFNATIEQVRERGMTLLAAIAMQTGWRIETLAGDLIGAERLARLGIEELEQLGERAWLSTQECELGEATYALGWFDEAETWATRGLEHGGVGDVLTQTMGMQLRAKLLAQRGEIGAALRLAEQGDELARSTQAPAVHGDAALTMAEVLHRAGRAAESEAALQRAIDCYELKGSVASVLRARALMAAWAEPTPG